MKQFSMLCRKLAKLDISRCLDFQDCHASNLESQTAKSFDVLGHYVGQESNRSFGGLTCLSPL
jgi:hypothetical protein